jgi:hypothetical protein
VNLLTRRERQRPTAREDLLMALEEAAARRQADIDRLAAERTDLVAKRSEISELGAAALMGEVSQGAITLPATKSKPDSRASSAGWRIWKARVWCFSAASPRLALQSWLNGSRSPSGNGY